ncbi:WbbJ Acetyltransferase (isoleucine patch superfamily) [Candidatus Nanopelagicaceae bacterium]
MGLLRNKFPKGIIRVALRQEIESWVMWVLRWIPGGIGFLLRTVAYKVLFAKLRGLSFIQHNVTIIYASRIRTGINFSCNSGTYINAVGDVVIGDNVLVGANVVISTGKHYLGADFGSILETPVLELPVTIGSGVWIGANVTILPGVIIGPGCIIGANSVLLKNTGPDEIWAGVPAKFVKKVESIDREIN